MNSPVRGINPVCVVVLWRDGVRGETGVGEMGIVGLAVKEFLCLMSGKDDDGGHWNNGMAGPP